MKRIKIFLLIVLIGIIFWAVSEVAPGPEDTIEKFVEAANNVDYYDMIECFDSVSQKALHAVIEISSNLASTFAGALVDVATSSAGIGANVDFDFEFDFAEYMKLVPILKIFTDVETPAVEAKFISVEYQGGVYGWIKEVFSVELSALGNVLADSAVVNLSLTIDNETSEGTIPMKREGIGWVIDLYSIFQMIK